MHLTSFFLLGRGVVTLVVMLFHIGDNKRHESLKIAKNNRFLASARFVNLFQTEHAKGEHDLEGSQL